MQLPLLKFDFGRIALQTLIVALVLIIGIVQSDA